MVAQAGGILRASPRAVLDGLAGVPVSYAQASVAGSGAKVPEPAAHPASEPTWLSPPFRPPPACPLPSTPNVQVKSHMQRQRTAHVANLLEGGAPVDDASEALLR